MAISLSQEDKISSKTDNAALDGPQLCEARIKDTERGELREIFELGLSAVEFRTVSWQRATVVFIKISFAMSILAVPGALATLGSVGGALSIIGFATLNTCRFKSLQTKAPLMFHV